MGYELLENDLTDSTLWSEGSDDAKILFITIFSKACGSEIVRTPIPVLFARAFKENAVERGRRALEELTAPDPSSRSKAHEGRRIVPITDDRGPGLLLPSYKERRNRYLSAERMRRKREGRNEDVTPRYDALRSRKTAKPGPPPARDVTPGYDELRSVTPRYDMFDKEAEKSRGEEREETTPPPPTEPGSGVASDIALPDDLPDEIEAITPVVSIPTPLDLQRVWNENRGHLPGWEGMTGRRTASAKARLRQHPDLAFWAELTRALAACPWTNGTSPGRDHPGWTANPDFLLRESTAVKFVEGDFTRNSIPAETRGRQGKIEKNPSPATDPPPDRPAESQSSEIDPEAIAIYRTRHRELLIEKLKAVLQDAVNEGNTALKARVQRQLTELLEEQKAELASILPEAKTAPETAPEEAAE